MIFSVEANLVRGNADKQQTNKHQNFTPKRRGLAI